MGKLDIKIDAVEIYIEKQCDALLNQMESYGTVNGCIIILEMLVTRYKQGLGELVQSSAFSTASCQHLYTLLNAIYTGIKNHTVSSQISQDTIDVFEKHCTYLDTHHGPATTTSCPIGQKCIFNLKNCKTIFQHNNIFFYFRTAMENMKLPFLKAPFAKETMRYSAILNRLRNDLDVILLQCSSLHQDILLQNMKLYGESVLELMEQGQIKDPMQVYFFIQHINIIFTTALTSWKNNKNEEPALDRPTALDRPAAIGLPVALDRPAAVALLADQTAWNYFMQNECNAIKTLIQKGVSGNVNKSWKSRDVSSEKWKDIRGVRSYVFTILSSIILCKHTISTYCLENTKAGQVVEIEYQNKICIALTNVVSLVLYDAAMSLRNDTTTDDSLLISFQVRFCLLKWTTTY